MKKIFGSVTTIIIVIVALCACGNSNNKNTVVATTIAETTECEHDFSVPTCTSPGVCKKCGKTGSPATGHNVNEWVTIDEPTCSTVGHKKGMCTVCGEEVTSDISMVAHIYDEGVISKEATFDGVTKTPGTITYTCINCGRTKIDSYSLSDEECEAYFKSMCTWPSYEELARNADVHMGEKMAFRGEVVQTLYGDDCVDIRLNITQNGDYYTYYTDTIYVVLEYTKGEDKILEDDIITVYGIGCGEYTYESIMGANVTLPLVVGYYWEF